MSLSVLRGIQNQMLCYLLFSSGGTRYIAVNGAKKMVCFRLSIHRPREAAVGSVTIKELNNYGFFVATIQSFGSYF